MSQCLLILYATGVCSVHDTVVLTHGAVVSQGRDLVDNGCFVRIEDEVSVFTHPFVHHNYIMLSQYVVHNVFVYLHFVLCLQRQYGFLLSCFKAVEMNKAGVLFGTVDVSSL